MNAQRFARVSKNSIGTYSVHIYAASGRHLAARYTKSTSRVQAIAKDWRAEVQDKDWQ